MKYNITINQAGVVAAGLAGSTDLVDWAILDYIQDWQAVPDAVRRGSKVWIDYKHLAGELPLLGLNSKSAVSNRITKLTDLGLLSVAHGEYDKRVYAEVTSKYIAVVVFSAKGFDFSGKVEPTKSCAGGVHENEQGDVLVNRGVHFGEQGVHESEHRLDNHDKKSITNVIDLTHKKNSGDSAQKKQGAQGEKQAKQKAVFDLLEDYGVVGQLAKDFVQHRKARRAEITITALDGFVREAGRSGIAVALAVERCIESGWIAYNHDFWVKRTGGGYAGSGTNNGKVSAREHSKRISEANRAAYFAACAAEMDNGVVC